MSDSFMDAMSSMGGGSDYTLDEIKKAEKLKKKNGGTLSENLIKVTGRNPSSMDLFAGADAVNRQLMLNQQKLDREIRELNENLHKDFGLPTMTGGQTASASDASSAGTGAALAPLAGEAALDAFSGVAAELEKKIFGQEAFIKKLIIAFKRPYVMPPEGKHAKNAMFVAGPEDTGRHLALCELAKELYARHILKSPDIRTVDLGIYPDAAMESIFLQDIYSALQSGSDILLFEHFEECHPSLLARISSLVTEGSFLLPGRYTMQKGQLVSVQNALASDVVSELSASGKYLVFLTEKSLDKAAGVLGAPFVDALRGDVCVTAKLDEEAIGKIAAAELEELKKRAAEQCFFNVTFAEGFAEYGADRARRHDGIQAMRDFYDSVLEALVQARLEGDYPRGTTLTLGVEDGSIYALNDGERIDLSALLPKDYRGEIDEIRREMDEIVGLADVKHYVLGLEEYYRVQKRREEEGLKTGSVSKHMIFTGSPGTGKTTIARIISRYLKAIGVLSGGQLVEVSRADLVGRYVGHTAPLTNQVIQSAIGGVLFIDEAYSLYRGRDDTFGLEAIDTLVKGIEDNRDNLIVILAGYSNEMQEFLTSNSGLKSRFPNIIHFPDYTGEELLKIARSIAKSKGYQIDEGADMHLTTYFNLVQATRAADAGNGRLARNLVEEAILNQSRRLAAEPDAALSVLMANDFDLSE
ncbi:MAG: AAA family ATPase [Lachnospiraceae bacterium]|nr:AAA family ATPase [Lachnospiraceae bacterium]